MVRGRGWLGGVLAGSAIALLPLQLAYSAPTKQPTKSSKDRTPHYIRPRVTCPSNVESLTASMLQDLPTYINRIHLRTIHEKTDSFLYAIAASQPDFVPLPAESSEYPNPPDKNLHQIFFTVLERQYVGQQIAEFQHYHWLFLTKTVDGWQIALMFSRLGFYPAKEQPVTPPRDSSQSLTAQAIRTWLRDCAAGSVRLAGPGQ